MQHHHHHHQQHHVETAHQNINNYQQKNAYLSPIKPQLTKLSMVGPYKLDKTLGKGQTGKQFENL
jgi:hypothetical protein